MDEVVVCVLLEDVEVLLVVVLVVEVVDVVLVVVVVVEVVVVVDAKGEYMKVVVFQIGFMLIEPLQEAFTV